MVESIFKDGSNENYHHINQDWIQPIYIWLKPIFFKKNTCCQIQKKQNNTQKQGQTDLVFFCLNKVISATKAVFFCPNSIAFKQNKSPPNSFIASNKINHHQYLFISERSKDYAS